MNTKLAVDPNIQILHYGRDLERKPTKSTIKHISDFIDQHSDQLNLQTLTDLYDNFMDASEGTRLKPSDFNQELYDQTLDKIIRLIKAKS